MDSSSVKVEQDGPDRLRRVQRPTQLAQDVRRAGLRVCVCVCMSVTPKRSVWVLPMALEKDLDRRPLTVCRTDGLCQPCHTPVPFLSERGWADEREREAQARVCVRVCVHRRATLCAKPFLCLQTKPFLHFACHSNCLYSDDDA